MTRVRDLLRALRHRWGSTLLVLVVATVSVAAATVGPTYNGAARTSIVRDGFGSAPGIQQGIDATAFGPVNDILPGLQSSVVNQAVSGLGGTAAERRLLGSPIDGLVVNASVPTRVPTITLAWRDGACAHLRLVSGRCPSQPGQILISPSLAANNGWHTGTRVTSPSFGHLAVSGVYAIPDINSVYWSLPSTSFFPFEETSPSRGGPDAAFTVQQTISNGPAGVQGSATVDLQVRVPQLTPADLDPLSATAQSLVDSQVLNGQGVSVQSGIPTAAQTIHASWKSLSTPIVVITGELLVLTWLLLFLVVVDAVEARAAEVALARLRGYGRWRSVGVAIAEPVTVLAVALPVGALVGWAVATVLGHSLRPGTPVPMNLAGWAGAALATVGGIAAVMTAASRVLRRPVVDQWRRTSRGATRRGWVVDAVLLTAAAAGLVQLDVGGAFATVDSGKGSHDSVVLLVPALIGVAVAVVASRLLPLACRASFGVTRRRGGLAGFLAVRQVARRPGGTRTVMVLVTAFALATFATGSWSVARANRHRVADVTTGATTVLTVAPRPGQDLATAVDRADPGGHQAVAVLGSYAGSTTLLAVQPQRFARVAAWRAAGTVPSDGLAALNPPAAAPIVLDGDAVRFRLAVTSLKPAARLSADLVVPGGGAPTPVPLGEVTRTSGTIHRTAPLSGCPCRLIDLDLAAASLATPVSGRLRIEAIDERRAGVWRPVPGIGNPSRWRSISHTATVGSAAAGGVSWSFGTVAGVDAILDVADRPEPLPAIVAKALAPAGGTVTPLGLDGNALPVRVIRTVPAVPGLPTTGVVVDLTYAERAALGGDSEAFQQVWIAPGAVAGITKRLTAQGVRVLATARSATAASRLSRQGPGLASMLFLLDAAAAALLAALGAIVGLAVSARRRRYEYAALAAGGVSRRVLRSSLLFEQLLVLVAGAVVGMLAGALAIAISVRSVPEFVSRPTAPPLSYWPSTTVAVVVCGAVLVVLILVAVVASRALLRQVRPSLLREPPA